MYSESHVVTCGLARICVYKVSIHDDPETHFSCHSLKFQLQKKKDVWENLREKEIWQSNISNINVILQASLNYLMFYCRVMLEALFAHFQPVKFRWFFWTGEASCLALQTPPSSDRLLFRLETAVHLSPLQLKMSLSCSAVSQSLSYSPPTFFPSVPSLYLWQAGTLKGHCQNVKLYKI